MKRFGEQGVVKILPILFIVAAVGLLSFLLIASTAPFQGGFSFLFPKPASHAATSDEQFAGPFASWDQVICNGSDDTAMLQSHLSQLGTAGHSPVLYVKAGICRITSSLYLDDTHGGIRYGGVSFLGADPSTTKIVWAGVAGGTMMYTSGIFNSRFGRLTWDGGGNAGLVYELTYNDAFSTGNRHEDEYFQNLTATSFAVRSGHAGTGDAETEWVRCHFIGPMAMGIFERNFNVLDYWIWDSEFVNTTAGIGNYNQIDGFNGAGAFAVNRSNFLNNHDDMVVANTMFYSSRWNYSKGAQFHIHGFDLGNVPAPWTSQGETIINPVQQVNKLGNSGALGMMDDTIVGGPATGGSQVWEGYVSPAGGEIWDIGNSFTNTDGGQYSAPAAPYGIGRYLIYGLDDKLGQSIPDPGPISLPPTPAKSTLPVIEVQNGDIAGALAQAGNSNVIVHIPYGHYQINQTLQVGPNVILVGDGNGDNGTNLQAGPGVNPVIHIAGPSHAEIRYLTTNSGTNNQRQGVGILIDNADQPGGLVHLERWQSQRNHVGVDVQNVQNTAVDFMAGSSGSDTMEFQDTTPSVDFSANAAKLNIFMAAGADSDREYQLLNGGQIISQNMFYQGGIHQDGVLEHPVMDGSNGTLILDGGNFAGAGDFNLSGLTGSATVIGIAESQNCFTDNGAGPKFGPNTLLINFNYGWASTPANCNTPPAFTGGPFVSRLNRHNTGGGSSEPGPEQDSGISDVAQFIRTHLAPERAAKPQPLISRSDNVTDVRITMAGANQATSGILIKGTPCTSNCATPQPTDVPTSSPNPTTTAVPTPFPTPNPTQGGGWIPPTCTGSIFTGCSDSAANVCTDWGDASRPNWNQTLWSNCQQACSGANPNNFCIASTATPAPTQVPTTPPTSTPVPTSPSNTPVVSTNGVCAPTGGYTGSGITISWGNSGVLYSDISTDSSFGAFYNKSVSGNSTVAPSGYLDYPSGIAALSIQANTTYFVRTYDSQGAHSPLASFSLPACSISTPSPASIPGDVNGDGKVDIFDYNIVVGNFNKNETPGTNGDLNGNGKVDIFDYNIIVGNFGKHN